MNPDRYQQVKRIFLSACERSDEDRAAHLVEACGEDNELRAEVEKMLAEDRSPIEALNTQTTGGVRKLAEAALANELQTMSGEGEEPLPKSIGPYRIVGKLGEGGMGIVFEAEQDQPRRRVALKVIRSVFASRTMLRRFEFEVQVLGRLEHPGIARIYEAGTAEDNGVKQPFFAMEYIDGKPITEDAQHRRLGTRERLELLARVCDAVHYAHQRGVIHRDLKPPNILVEERHEDSSDGTGMTGGFNVGRPKVLDFGVARATEGEIQRETILTDAGAMIGTVPYMSPEQLKGEIGEIDVRSDVYALGVILFEMLAGKLPFDLGGQSPLEAAQTVCETDPMRLSAFSAAYRGDVETIVSKALSKEADRRYQSAAQFGADLRRFLRDEPILARPATAMYQVRKFARRHKIMVTAAALALAGVLGGSGMAIWQASQATKQRDRAQLAEFDANTQRDIAITAQGQAETQRDRAREAEADAIAQRDLAQVSQRQATAVNQFLTDMLHSVDPRRTPNRDITMVEVLDAAAATLGDRFREDPMVEAVIQETIADVYLNLGKFERAEHHEQRVLELARDNYGEDAAVTHIARTNLALAYRELSRLDEAYELALVAREGLLATRGPDDSDTIDATSNLALVLNDLGRYSEAETLLRDTLERQGRLLGKDHAEYLRILTSLASTITSQGRAEEAEPLYIESIEGRIELLGELHPDVLIARNNLGSVYLDLGRFEEAERILLEVVATATEIFGDDHPTLYSHINNLAGVYRQLGQHDKSLPLFSRVYEFRMRDLGEKHGDTLTAMNNLGGAYEGLGHYDRAEPFYVNALNGRRELFGDENPHTMTSINNLGFLYRNLKRYKDAEPFFEEAMHGFERTLGPEHPRTLITTSNLGSLYNLMELYSEGEPINLRVLEGLKLAVPPDHWLLGLATMRYGESLSGLKRFEEAEPLLLDAHRILAAAMGDPSPRANTAAQAIVDHFERQQMPERAQPWRERIPVTTTEDH